MVNWTRLKLSLILFLLTLSSSNVAAESALVLSGFSYHPSIRQFEYKDEIRPINEFNAGFGFEYDDFRTVWFRNSYYKPSVAFIWVPQTPLGPNLALGYRVGLTTGYDDTPMELPVAPVLGVELDFKIDNVHFIVGTQAPIVLTAHLQIEY